MAKLKILSIDGGGSRGIIPATILDCMKNDGIDPYKEFDLFAGTSTGGIINIGLLSGVPIHKLVDLYENKSQEIFDDSWWDNFTDGFGKNLGANYSNKNLKKILIDILGDKTLGDLNEELLERVTDEDDKYDLVKKLMVCSFHLNPKPHRGNKNFRPKVYHSSYLKHANLKLWELALMTSAGPTYFPIYKSHIDGGVALNNPSMAALSFAINKQTTSNDENDYRYPNGVNKGLGKDIENISLLSLSCGTANKDFISKKRLGRKDSVDWGNLDWVSYLPDLLTTANMQTTEYYIEQLLHKSQYLRIPLLFDDNRAPKSIRNEKLGLDVTKKTHLLGMKEFAKKMYIHYKDAIIRLLEDNE